MIQSNGLRYNLDAVDSVQLLQYTSMVFHGLDGDAGQETGLLPCRVAEMVIQTKAPTDGAEDGDVYQLVLQCKQATTLHLYYICAFTNMFR